MIRNEEDLQETLHWIEVFNNQIERLKERVLPKSRQWYKLMAEGPEEEIKRLQADVDDYLARKERTKPRASRQRKRS
jgi:hypothetical protein